MSDNISTTKTSLKGQGKGAFMKNYWHPNNTGVNAPSPEDIITMVKSETPYQYLYQMPIEELQTRIAHYLTSIIVTVNNPTTGEVFYKWLIPPTIKGLAVAIGFTEFTIRQYMEGEYKVVDGKADYGDCAKQHIQLIKKTIEFLGSYHEGKLSTNGNPAGSIFWLKNVFGWKDEQTVALKPADPMANVQSVEELDKLTLPPAENEE